MTIDLDALEAAIAEGEKKNFFVAPIVKELVAELRKAREERAAVVAFLREGDTVCMQCGDRATLDLAYRIELGEHRKEKA